MENSAIDYIGGKYSFGDLMESEGYAAVPSPAQRRPPGKSLFYLLLENSLFNKEVCNRDVTYQPALTRKSGESILARLTRIQ